MSMEDVINGSGEQKRMVFRLFSSGLAPSDIAMEMGIPARVVRKMIVGVWAEDRSEHRIARALAKRRAMMAGDA